MTAVAIAEDQDQETPEAAEALEGLARLRLSGPLIAATAPAIRSRVREALARGQARLLVDLQAVTGLDAVGIAALLEARRLTEAQPGGTLVLRANGIVCRALRESGTITAFALWNGHGM
jgi:anti-anti-sigma factor